MMRVERPESRTRARARALATLIVLTTLLIVAASGLDVYTLTPDAVTVLLALVGLVGALRFGAHWQNVKDLEVAADAAMASTDRFEFGAADLPPEGVALTSDDEGG